LLRAQSTDSSQLEHTDPQSALASLWATKHQELELAIATIA